MIRRLARGLARRLVARAPRVPHAPPSGRDRPSTREAWSPPPGATIDADDAEGAAEPPDDDDAPEVELSAEAVAARLQGDPSSVVVLDIREPHELRQGHLAGALVLPMNDIPDHLHLLPRDTALAVTCAAGMRSFGVAHYLREQGFAQAWSVPEGAAGLAHAGLPWTHPAPAPHGLAPGHRARTAGGVAGHVQAIVADGDAVSVTLLVAGADGPSTVAVAAQDLTRG